jgi:hypothetical protein
LPLAALRKAPRHAASAEGLIDHSDRGSQYCSVDHQAELRRYGIRIAMSGKGNCFDNDMVETFLKTINPSASGEPSSTTPSGATPRSTTTAPRRSNEPRHTEQIPLHLSRAGPASNVYSRGDVSRRIDLLMSRHVKVAKQQRHRRCRWRHI